jgi:phage gp16-like protein
MTPNAKKIIGAVKAGQAFLELDDATYRALIARLTDGKTSAAKCSLNELIDIKEHMHKLGFPRTSQRGRRPRVAKGRQAVLGKIEALLAEADRTWAYAEGMAKKMYQQPVIEWLTDEQVTGIMQALIYDARRRGHNNG